LKTNSFILVFVLIFGFCGERSTAQWIGSNGMDGGDCQSVVVLDSTLFACMGGNGIFSRNITGGSWQQSLTGNYLLKIIKAGDALFTIGLYSWYRSLDHGITWEDMYQSGNYASSIASSDTHLFIIKSDAIDDIERSDDYGTTFYSVQNNMPSYAHLKVFANNTTVFCQQKNNNKIYKSVNLGLSWDSIPYSGFPSYWMVNDVYQFNNQIWTSNYQGVYLFNEIAGNWTLIDSSVIIQQFGEVNGNLIGGGNGFYQWNPVSSHWDPENSGLQSNQIWGLCTSNSIVFCASSLGPYKCSAPYTWEGFYDGLHQTNVRSVSCLGNEVWTITDAGLFRSPDNGEHFTPQQFSGSPVRNGLILTSYAYYMITDSAFYASYDHGITWQINNTGLPAPPVPPYLTLYSLAKTSNFLYLGSNLGLFRSSVLNLQWELLPSFGTGNLVSVDLYATDSILLATKSPGSSYYYTFRSIDNGVTFDSLEAFPGNESHFFSGNNNNLFALTINHLFNSTDRGLTWPEIPMQYNGYPYIEAWNLASEDPALFAGGQSCIDTFGYDIYLSVTYDKGITWYDVCDNLPVPNWPVINCVAVNSTRVFTASSENGLYYRDDLFTGNKEIIKNENDILQVSPNPVVDNADLTINLPQKGEGAILLYDITGKPVFQSGTIQFNNGISHEVLNMQDLPHGLYLVSLTAGTTMINRKIIK